MTASQRFRPAALTALAALSFALSAAGEASACGSKPKPDRNASTCCESTPIAPCCCLPAAPVVETKADAVSPGVSVPTGPVCACRPGVPTAPAPKPAAPPAGRAFDRLAGAAPPPSFRGPATRRSVPVLRPSLPPPDLPSDRLTSRLLI